MSLPVDPGSAAAGAAAVAAAVSMSDVPKEAWMIAVQSASVIVSQFLAPLTSTTSGLGRLITAKLDGKVELEKVLVADTIRRAQEKIGESQKPMRESFEPSVVIPILEECSKQGDETLRDLWAKLLATELTDGGVHPEVVRALGILTGHDARRFIEIVQFTRIHRELLYEALPECQRRGYQFERDKKTKADDEKIADAINEAAPRSDQQTSLPDTILLRAGLIEMSNWTHLTPLGDQLVCIVCPEHYVKPLSKEERGIIRYWLSIS